MGSRCPSRSPFAIAALVAAMLAPARAGEPSARELIALAPVLDSSDKSCRSLDVGGYVGEERGPGPRLMFRALYRAPDRFGLLISDAADGTPLALCSGQKMFVYDPVGPTLYYSEDAGFNMELSCTNGELKYATSYLLKSRTPHHILVDLRSILLVDRVGGGGSIEDRVVRRGAERFELVRNINDRPCLSFNVDLARQYPYTSVALLEDGVTTLCLNKLVRDGVPKDDLFAFPSKGRLPRGLPVRDVTADADAAAGLNTTAVVVRAAVVRSVLNKPGRPRPGDIPGLSGVDWDRVKENDKKFSKALRDLVPASLRRADGHRD